MFLTWHGTHAPEIRMSGSFPRRLHLALLCLIAFGPHYLLAQTSGMFLCIGNASSNFQLANYQSCGKTSAATILSFSFGASLPVTSTGGTVTVGQVSVQQFTFQKSSDATTTRWARSLYSNTPVAQVLVIGVNTPGPGGNVNVTIRLTNPRVIQFLHSGAGVDVPTETVSMSYDSLTVFDNSTSPAKIVRWTGP